MVQKLKFSLNAYAYARVSAMSAKLLKAAEYRMLLKMKIAEIARFLEESEYKKEVDMYAIEYEGVSLVERAVSQNLANTFRKILRMSDETMQIILNNYLKKWDIENIKTIIRAKQSDMKNNQIIDLLVPAGCLDKNRFTGLLIENEPEQILIKSGIIDMKYFKEALDVLKHTGNMFYLENQLDKYYYDQLILLSEKIPSGGAGFKNLILTEIDLLNIKNLFDFKKTGQKNIEKYIFYSGLKLNRALLNEMIAAGNLDELSAIVKKSAYKKIVSDAQNNYSKDSFLIGIEMESEKLRLRKAKDMSQLSPISVNKILSYMLRKEIERKNLIKIIKSKQIDLAEDIIKKQIIAG
ncbi:hypothetical protein GF327_04910 [Candidatus Woesearchaeota archaeon]|nr:hypothetical protein [Candidatus Woesearchaeota archaeon]